MDTENHLEDSEYDTGTVLESVSDTSPSKRKFPYPSCLHHLHGRQTIIGSVIALCTFIFGCFLGLWIAHMNTTSEKTHSISFSPAESAISHRELSKHATDHNAYSRYSGAPSPEQDRAWEALMGPVMIHVSREKMLLADEGPDDSVRLQKDPTEAYLASLGVFHELHCLRRIRYFLHKDHCYPIITSEQQQYEEKHIDHCLETLRLSSMCSADIGLYTFRWPSHHDHSKKLATKSNSVRQCVDWDRLHEWAEGRSVGFNPVL